MPSHSCCKDTKPLLLSSMMQLNFSLECSSIDFKSHHTKYGFLLPFKKKGRVKSAEEKRKRRFKFFFNSIIDMMLSLWSMIYLYILSFENQLT